MAHDWEESTVAEEADIVLGFAFRSAEFATEPPGHRLVRGDNIKRGVLEWGDKTRYWRSLTSDLDRYVLRAGDVVVGMDGSRVGENFARIAPEDLPALLVQRVACLRARHRLDQRFLRYLICNPQFTAYVKAVHTGTSIPHISGGQIGDYPIRVPPLNEQQAIAHALGTLDDKIELNQRMNETLGAIARVLFKSWFVDFDPVRAKAEGRDPGLPKEIADLFPDGFEASELGEIPRGWAVCPVGEHMTNFDSKRVPVSGAERTKRQGPYPYHGAAGVMDYVDAYLFDGIYLLVGEDGSVMRENGTAVTQYVWGRLWVNNHAHVLQGRDSVSTEQLYLYFQFESVMPYVTGAVQPKLSKGRMNTMPFLFAGPEICAAFAETVHPLFARLRSNANMNKTLADIRDLLLPKLISGEVRVNAAPTQSSDTA